MALTFLVGRDKELQVMRELKMPKALPRHSGGNCQEEARLKDVKNRRKRKRERDGCRTAVEERNAERNSSRHVAE